jgi:hypothetical protein
MKEMPPNLGVDLKYNLGLRGLLLKRPVCQGLGLRGYLFRRPARQGNTTLASVDFCLKDPFVKALAHVDFC